MRQLHIGVAKVSTTWSARLDASTFATVGIAEATCPHAPAGAVPTERSASPGGDLSKARPSPRSFASPTQTSSTFQEAFHSSASDPPGSNRIYYGMRPTHTRVYWYRGGCGAREVAGVPERRSPSSLHSVSCARAGS